MYLAVHQKRFFCPFAQNNTLTSDHNQLYPLGAKLFRNRPAVCLPGLSKPSVAVRCNPRLFALKGGTAASRALCDLPYRVVFAVVSLDAVVVYDTEHSHPLTVATGLHYAGLTDACW